ncbi:MAG: glycosyltransferase [Candidatus Omnitrophica bacterium]|nr:glycosyltransferase [Candidatus Omnitrophota bacterium]
MNKKRILLMYITPNSGHHRASLAIEKALREFTSDKVEIFNIDAFTYTNPILARIINRTYMSLIKNKPEVWDYLYDNPKIVKNTQKFREIIHRFNSGKLKILLEDFRPHAVVCTQAFPCGMIADYKKTYGFNTSLIGVLTDYVAHSYWLYDSVDFYVVPSEDTAHRLKSEGVPGERIRILGIPVAPEFRKEKDKSKIFEKLNLNPQLPVILIMGGSQGLGPINKIVNIISHLPTPLQMVVICGRNKFLYKKLSLRKRNVKKPLLILGYIDNIDELMEISTVLITKPGGLTTAEALAKGIPMVIIRPLPGQEAKNTDFLLKANVALKANDELEVGILLRELLTNPLKLEQMHREAIRYGYPDSSLQIAKLIIENAL